MGEGLNESPGLPPSSLAQLLRSDSRPSVECCFTSRETGVGLINTRPTESILFIGTSDAL